MIIEWTNYPNFKEDEFKCKHCGKCEMHPLFLQYLQTVRNLYAKPIYIYSGYRCEEHPVEKEKDRPGEHTYGMAADIACSGNEALQILEYSQKAGIKRIGINQKGVARSRFIHIGIANQFRLGFPVAIWTY